MTPTRDFKPGDVVKFRQWEDMEAEYGTHLGFDGRPVINCPLGFNSDMRKLCGETVIVDYVVNSDILRYVYLKKTDHVDLGAWSFSPDMFEYPEYSEPDIIITESDLHLILDEWR